MALLSKLIRTLKNQVCVNRKFKKLSVNNYYLINRSASSFTLRSDNILCSVIPDIDIPKISVGEWIFQDLDKWPDHIAVECAVTGRKYTFSEVRKKSSNLGKNLRKKFKLSQNDVIAVLLPNVPEFPIAALGCLEAGLTVSAINPIYTTDEIKRQLEDSSAKAIITLDVLCKRAEESMNLLQKSLPIISIQTQPGFPTPEGAISFKELTDNEVDMPNIIIKPEHLAFLPYSSGTTALPKGVQLTHSNVVSNLAQIDSPEVQTVLKTSSAHQDIVPGVLPFFHIYGLVVVLLHALHVGAKTVTLPKFTPEIYINMLKQHRPDVLFLVPPIIIFMAAHPAVTVEDIACVRAIMSGAAPLGALDEERLKQKARKDIIMLQGYGLTESSPVIAMLYPKLLSKPNKQGSVGRLMANTQAKIVALDDPNGKPLGPHQTGELYVKGPQVMKGYHNQPEENQIIFKDGWMRTGDVFRYDEDGYMFCTDRLKELIKVKGFQVPPAELEEVIRDHPDIAEAAVIGIPHEAYGEAPRAYVVPKPNVKLDPKKIEEYVNSKVAHYKQLYGGICVMESIPKSASGKILKKELKRNHERGKEHLYL